MDVNMSFPDEIKQELNRAISNGIALFKRDFGEGRTSFTRSSELTHERMIQLLLSMNGGSLEKELYKAGIKAGKSAFSQRRKQLSNMEWEYIFEQFNQSDPNVKTYKGYRIFAVDGTTVNMPRNPQAATFVQNAGNPKGYNQFHVNPLYDVLSKTYAHCVIQPQPKQDEIGALRFMLNWYDYPEKTLMVADRGYESYNLIAHFLENKVDFLIRVKQDRSAMRAVKSLPMTTLDKDVSFTITTTQTNEDKENDRIFIQTRKNESRAYSAKTKASRWDFPSPYNMQFRVVRFMLSTGEYETLVTSLKRGPGGFSIEELKELYHARWGIETAFRELKYGLGLVNLHGRSDEFVRQEIFAALIMANFCSRIASQVVIGKKKSNIHAYKVDMRMAVFLCKQFYAAGGADGEKLIQDIARYTEPIRPGRADERNIRAKSWSGFVYRVAA